MRQLLLLRHAKSSRKDPSLDDFDRPLSKRGRKSCKLMGEWLKQEDLVPDLIISSPAVRARQTTERLCKKIGYAAKAVQWEDSIYDATVRDLLKILSAVDEETKNVMLVGHHAALDTMILRLSNWADIPADPKLIPTGAIARFDIPGKWSDIKRCDAHLISITKPRELAAVLA